MGQSMVSPSAQRVHCVHRGGFRRRRLSRGQALQQIFLWEAEQGVQSSERAMAKPRCFWGYIQRPKSDWVNTLSINIYNLFKRDGSCWAPVFTSFWKAGLMGPNTSWFRSVSEALRPRFLSSYFKSSIPHAGQGMSVMSGARVTSCYMSLFPILKDSFLVLWTRLLWSVVSFCQNTGMNPRASTQGPQLETLFTISLCLCYPPSKPTSIAMEKTPWMSIISKGKSMDLADDWDHQPHK